MSLIHASPFLAKVAELLFRMPISGMLKEAPRMLRPWNFGDALEKNGTSPAIVTVKVIGHVSDVENLMKESWTFVTTMEA